MKGLLKRLVRHYGVKGGYATFLRIKFGPKGQIQLPGLKHPLYLRPNTVDMHTFKEIFLLREYDVKLPTMNGEPRLIIDGGANIGFTSVFFTEKYKEARIIAVEPEKKNFDLMVKNTCNYPNITAINSGIWNHEAYLRVVDKGFGLRGFTVEEVPAPADDSFKATSIPHLMGEEKFIDILKLDIEGSEKFVFEKGYEHWLAKTKCLIIELHDRFLPGSSLSFFRAISKFNFSMQIKGENLVFFNEDLPPENSTPE